MTQEPRPWSVWKDGWLDTPNTYGPFLPEPGDDDDGLKAAERFAASLDGHVYNHVENRKSLCGPWLP